MTTTITKSVSFIGAVAILAAAYSVCFSKDSLAKQNDASAKAIQTVTISAKRMNQEERQNYDQALNQAAAQTIVVNAKHLENAEKIAFDKSTPVLRANKA